MRRLDDKLLARTKKLAHRIVDVAIEIEKRSESRFVVGRIVSQMVGAGTSVGANSREADEAVSRPDFCKCLGTVLKELSESRFWIEFIGEREWVKPKRLEALHNESTELSKVFSVMVARTRQTDSRRGPKK